MQPVLVLPSYEENQESRLTARNTMEFETRETRPRGLGV